MQTIAIDRLGIHYMGAYLQLGDILVCKRLQTITNGYKRK